MLLAVIVGSGVDFYISNEFLNAFSFHTDINPIVFVIAVLGIVIISMLTILYKTAQASQTNPVESLRSE